MHPGHDQRASIPGDLQRLLFQHPTVGSSLLGLLLGLGMIVYMLYSIKRGYILGRVERRGYKHISRAQEPLSFWTPVILILLVGLLVEVICGVALWKGISAF
jgi:hypothetical protein